MVSEPVGRRIPACVRPDRLRILADVDFYAPTQLGGSELALHHLLRWLARRGHEVRACVKHKRAAMIFEGVDRRYPGFEARREWWQWCDVAFTQHAATEHASRFAGDFDKPLVFYSHNRGQVDLHSEHLPQGSLVLFNSEAEQADWARSLVCRPPVFREDYDVQRTRAARVTQVNLSSLKGGATFWDVARAEQGRQFLGVIGAWQVAGDAQQIPAEIPDHVEIQQTTPDMRAVYARTRVLLMPSQLETWGRVGVEAAASGIPTIAHPTPGLVEALGDMPIWVDRADTQGWRDALATLDDPAEYARRSEMATARSEELDRQAHADCEAVEHAIYELVG